jgi:hypothetical protein
MTQIIYRAFGNAAQADQAVKALRVLGLGGRQITVVEPPAGASGGADVQEKLVATLKDARIRIARARDLAQRIVNGDTVVCVAAPFGLAMPAINALEEAGPLDLGFEEPGEAYVAAGEVAAAFSEALSLPVLTRPGPVLSRFFGLPTLLPAGKALGFGHLLGTGAKPYSGFLGLPLLSGGSAGKRTGFLGLPLLSGNGDAYKGLLGLPLLTRKS